MAKQDDWTRITLRLPSDLHARIVEAAEAGSLNATIVAALEEKYPQPATLLPIEIEDLLYRLLDAPIEVREEIHPLLRMKLDEHGIPMTERLSDPTIQMLLGLPMDSDEDDRGSGMPDERAKNALRFLSSGKRAKRDR